MLPHITGRYYTHPLTRGTTTSGAQSVNVLRLHPFVVPVAGTYDRIAAQLNTGSGGNVRLGIYGPLEDDPATMPLILETASTPVPAGGVDITINQQLSAGWYFLAHLVDNATPSWRLLTVGDFLQQLGQGTPNNAYTDVMLTVNHAYGALPDPLGAITAYSTSAPPALWLRRA